MLPLEPITIVDQWKKKGHFLVLLRALLTWANISAQTSFTLFVYNTSSKNILPSYYDLGAYY
jgi:hypothetical protein